MTHDKVLRRVGFRLMLGLLLASSLTSMRGQVASDAPVRVELIWSQRAVLPGHSTILGVKFDMDEGFHVNPAQPDVEFLIPTSVSVREVPEGVRVDAVRWPVPTTATVNYTGEEEALRVYEDGTVIHVPVRVEESVAPGEYPVRLRVGWQACDDRVCLAPEEHELTATLVVTSDPEEAVESEHAALFAVETEPIRPGVALAFFGADFTVDARMLWLLLVLAALGGMLLNFTPCVLPLIPIKIMGLTRATGSRGRMLLLGVAMAAGVVAFWLVLGGVIALSAAAVARGSEAWISSTNELFQYPAFTITVGIVIAVMAIGMCGLFSIRLPQWTYRMNPSQDTIHGSFLFGIMAAVLSTPCTAPFMGAAAAWAVGQSPLLTLLTFASIGFGMAAPYLILAANPKWISAMPRTGPASELIKQVMGLLMLAAAAFFLGTGLSGLLVTPPDPPTKAYWWAIAALVAAAGLWLGWRTWRITASWVPRLSYGVLGLVLVASAIWGAAYLTWPGPIRWTYYTPERLERAFDQGKIVVLDFTAEWCLNCHALERAVLFQDRVAERLNHEDVAAIKIDLTGNNPAGNRKLTEVGRRTIPLLIIYGVDGREVFRSDAYTIGQVLDALDEAAQPADGPAALAG